MANVVDQDQHWLLNCLSATLDPNHEVRCFAEASLNQASLQPGFVLLKQFVKKHWQEGEDTFEPPVVSSHEKVVICEILLLALDESHKKICTAISLAVASIAEYDWPDFWPDLLPFLLSDALEVLEAIKSIPGCLHPLVSRILPYVGPILSEPQEQADGLVAGSLYLVTMLLKNAPVDVAKAIYDVCFNSTIRIVLQSDDHSEIQNATECLAAFISEGRQEVLAWGSNCESTMRSLLEITSRLLDPNLESSGSLFLGVTFFN
ncbi:hypothetical protein K1719_032350 [Acacia pycnantha]|nr:hypothetical protein K1719_032350 [Acacia pycnantha]